MYAKEQFGYDISLTVSYDEKFIYKNDSAIVANMDTVYLDDGCIQQDIGLAA